MDKRVVAGLVGFGLAGKVFHGPLLHSSEFINFKYVVERKTSESKEIYDYIEIVRSLDELLQKQDLQLVIIATPSSVHYEQAFQCLRAGKHVVVDKPFTSTSIEADELIQFAQQQGVLLSVFQNRRWDSDFLTVKKLINEKSNQLGKLVEFQSSFNRFRPDVTNRWREQSLPGSGVLYDLGAHLIDQAVELFGLPDEIFADVRNQRENSLIDDYFEVTLYYNQQKSLVVKLFSGCIKYITGPRFLLQGTNGGFMKFGLDAQEQDLKDKKLPLNNSEWGKEAEDLYGTLSYRQEGHKQKEVIVSERGDYLAFYNNVAQTILGNAELAVNPISARNVIRIIELCLESQQQRKVVSFS